MAKRYYTVWSVDFENDNKAKVSLSRSRKVKDNSYDKKLEDAGIANNGYITEFSDSFVEFIGKAANQLKKYDIKARDRIYCDIEITNEPYVDKDGKKAYPKGYKHKVYEFELPGSSDKEGQPADVNQIRNFDRPPIVDDKPASKTEEDDSLPF